MCISIYVSVTVSVCLSVCLCLSLHIYIYVYVCVCVCVCVYILSKCHSAVLCTKEWVLAGTTCRKNAKRGICIQLIGL